MKKFIIIWSIILAVIYVFVRNVSEKYLTEEQREVPWEEVRTGSESEAAKPKQLSPWERQAQKARERREK